MALLSIIRRWHLRDQVSIREIAKRLGTVRKYLRAETIEPNYAPRKTPSALDDYAFKLTSTQKTVYHWGDRPSVSKGLSQAKH